MSHLTLHPQPEATNGHHEIDQLGTDPDPGTMWGLDTGDIADLARLIDRHDFDAPVIGHRSLALT